MKIEILDQAEKDLIDGFAFYEGQSKGLGNISLIPSSQILNHSAFMLESTVSILAIIDFLPSDSRLPFIIKSQKK